jgi:DNA-binding transcriptional LysR family regulator
MSWKSIKFDWNHAKAFLVTAEEGSLVAAARALGVAQPTLSRQVAALEEELGVPLFARHGRGLQLTPNGMELMEHVRAMGAAAGSLSLAASGRNESFEGSITISASEVMAAYVLPWIVEKLGATFPGMTFGIVASNKASNLTRREADIALRLFQPTQPEVICKKVAEITANLYATPEYLHSLGDPQQPAGFSQARFLGAEDNGPYMDLLRQCGFTLTARNFPIVTESRVVQWELAKHGLGLCPMQEDVGDREACMARALPRIERMKAALWLVTHQELKTNRGIRAVFDFIGNELSARIGEQCSLARSSVPAG